MREGILSFCVSWGLAFHSYDYSKQDLLGHGLSQAWRLDEPCEQPWPAR